MTLMEAASLKDLVHVYLPRCSPSSIQDVLKPAMLCGVEMRNYSEATRKGYGGWNNWSGGLCAASSRSPYDRRFITLDGFSLLL